MNTIEKIRELFFNLEVECPIPINPCLHGEDTDCAECLWHNILTTLGLTDHQIEALGKEDTGLAVVYKEGRLPENPTTMDDVNEGRCHEARLSAYEKAQQDMLAQGWCKKVEK